MYEQGYGHTKVRRYLRDCRNPHTFNEYLAVSSTHYKYIPAYIPTHIPTYIVYT